MSSLGFPLALYTHIDNPRRPDGTYNPLPLTVRNFPKNWDRLWHRYSRMDPYYHAAINSSYVVDWQKIRARGELCDVQHEACHYLDDVGISQGITVPIHHHGGGFTAVSAICATSETDWPLMFRQVSEQVFVTAHRFHDKYYGLYVSENGEEQASPLSAREIADTPSRKPPSSACCNYSATPLSGSCLKVAKEAELACRREGRIGTKEQ